MHRVRLGLDCYMRRLKPALAGRGIISQRGWRTGSCWKYTSRYSARINEWLGDTGNESLSPLATTKSNVRRRSHMASTSCFIVVTLHAFIVGLRRRHFVWCDVIHRISVTFESRLIINFDTKWRSRRLCNSHASPWIRALLQVRLH